VGSTSARQLRSSSSNSSSTLHASGRWLTTLVSAVHCTFLNRTTNEQQARKRSELECNEIKWNRYGRRFTRRDWIWCM